MTVGTDSWPFQDTQGLMPAPTLNPQHTMVRGHDKQGAQPPEKELVSDRAR